MKKTIAFMMIFAVFAVSGCDNGSQNTSSDSKTLSTVESSASDVSADASVDESIDLSVDESIDMSIDESVCETSSEDIPEVPAMPEITEFYNAAVNKNQKQMTISSGTNQAEGLKCEVKLIKNAWGTWRLDGYTVTDKKTNVRTQLGAGSTDWEYVFSAGSSSGKISHCGGNHDYETLISLEIYDAKTGVLLGGDKDTVSKIAGGVKIVQKTQVNFPEDKNNPVPFVNVVRTYIINGIDVWLDCDFDYIEDAYCSIFYSAMCPISKKTGNNIVFYLKDGTQVEHKTKTSGTASGKDYGADFFQGYSAPSVDMYGDSTPNLRMNVTVYNPYLMLDNYSGPKQAMVWDMNSIANKLYFTKFYDNAVHKIEKGTHWDTLTRWGLNLDVYNEG